MMNQQKGWMKLGAFKHMLAQSSLWLSAMNFLMIAVTAYWTTLREHLLIHAPWFKMWMFILVLLFLWFLIMFIEYKIIYPSWIKFQNKQEYEHENLLRVDHSRLEERLKRIEGKLGIEDTDSAS